jgi:hypothetical protein
VRATISSKPTKPTKTKRPLFYPSCPSPNFLLSPGAELMKALTKEGRKRRRRRRREKKQQQQYKDKRKQSRRHGFPYQGSVYNKNNLFILQVCIILILCRSSSPVI